MSNDHQTNVLKKLLKIPTKQDSGKLTVAKINKNKLFCIKIIKLIDKIGTKLFFSKTRSVCMFKKKFVIFVLITITFSL